MSQGPGLRERKKQETRSLIADAAGRLFAERGFDAVTVAEIAREANVSEATVFNYFPAKEDLFYSRLEAFEEELLEAIRQRQPGESVLAAFRGFLLKQRGVLAKKATEGHDEATKQVRTITRVITESPALLAREGRSSRATRNRWRLCSPRRPDPPWPMSSPGLRRPRCSASTGS